MDDSQGAEMSASEKFHACDHCDYVGGRKTYANQACVPINGKVQCIDWCIHQMVAALNAGGVETVGSCCGHGKMPGNIVLADGRVLVIFASMDDARMQPDDEDDTTWRPPRLDGTRARRPGE